MIRELLGVSRPVPEILQSERAECGLACIAMVAGHYGYDVDLPTLRQRFACSAFGATLRELVDVSARLDLVPRPIKAPMEALAKLRLPVILHWDFEHFVVLVKVRSDGSMVIHDPASGRVVLPTREVSAHYTGVAVELWPSPDFRPRKERAALSFGTLLRGAIPGVAPLGHALVFALLTQALSMSVPLLGQFLVDTVVPTGDMHSLDMLGLAILFIGASLFVTHLARGLVFVWLSTAIHSHLTRSLFRHLLQLPISFFQRRHASELVARFESLRVIQRILGLAFVEAVVDGLGMLLSIVAVCVYSSTIGLIATGSGLLYLVARRLLQQRYVVAHDEQVQKGSIVQTSFIETMRGIESIKVHNNQYVRDVAVGTQMTAWFNAGARVQALTALFASTAAVLQSMTMGAALWFGGRMAVSGELGVGALLACVALTQVFSIRFVALVDKLADFRMLSIHRARLTDVYSVEREPEMQGNGLLAARDLQGAIELADVSFRYEEHRPWILRNASLRIDAGEFVAIVGESGAGKSTLLRILLGLHDPDSGVVRIDGHDLAAIGKENYRDIVGVVLQDDDLFAGSILNNICFFDPAPDLERVEECARTAGIHDFISTLPMAYRTLVGDMGSLLSGGQSQRLFLARALYRQPRVLLLDEATSHLDLAKEKEINHAIARLGITRIVIAHRPETIRAADRVVRLTEGHLVEETSLHSVAA